MKTRQAVLVAPRKFELREADLVPGPGQLLIKVAVCGLCNWEQNHWKGIIEGCPQTLGHEWAGMVVETGAGVKGFSAGDKVTGLLDTLSAFADYVVTGTAACFKLDDHVDPAVALGEPLKCVVTVLRAAAPEVGDVGVILGCGPMGLWCVQAAGSTSLAALVAVDISPAKLDLAGRFGATHVINPREEDAVSRIREISGGHMADFVIEGSGVPELIADAVKYLRNRRGRLAVMSAHERAAGEFDWRLLQGKGAILMSTHPPYSLDGIDDMRRAVQLVNNGTFRMDGIISHRFPLDRIEEGFAVCEEKPGNYVKGVIIP